VQFQSRINELAIGDVQEQAHCFPCGHKYRRRNC
jgi:hypothetical protein